MFLSLLNLLGTLLDGVLKILPILLVSKQSKKVGELESDVEALTTINEVNTKSEKIVKDVSSLSDDELYNRLYNKD